MAIIDDAINRTAVGISDAQRIAFQAELTMQFWLWFYEHYEDVILTRKVAFWTVKIRVKDLRPVFELVFGVAMQGVP